jgi:hypothetical protein
MVLYCYAVVFFLFMNLTVSGYAGTGGGRRVRGREYTGTGTRVNGYGYNRFFPKKKLPAFLKLIPVYLPIPGHGYGLYPAGFNKPLAETVTVSH